MPFEIRDLAASLSCPSVTCAPTTQWATCTTPSSGSQYLDGELLPEPARRLRALRAQLREVLEAPAPRLAQAHPPPH